MAAINDTKSNMGTKMIIHGGKLATSKGLRSADLEIDEELGIISNILPPSQKTRSLKSRDKVYDATGKIIFPGGIDPHVHLRDPQSPQKEDFYTGTCAALAGGYTTVFDMPNYFGPATTTAAAYSEKGKIASSKAVCNWALHFGATPTNHAEVKKANPPTLKAYLGETDSELTFESLEGLLGHFEQFPHNRPICVHAEDLDALKYFAKRFEGGRFSVQRPPAVAQAAAARVAILSTYFKRKIHLCHATTELEMLSIKQNPLATLEVTPHHLFLDSSYEKKLAGKLHHVKPPLRVADEVFNLWQTLPQIDCIASDHAPHTLEEKQQGAAGFPGLETTLPLMLWAYKRKVATIESIVRLCMEGPAKIFGLERRGAINEGYAADLAIFDLTKSWKVSPKTLFTKCGWSPFEGMEIGPRPDAVFVGGKLAFENGQILAKKGSGKRVI